MPPLPFHVNPVLKHLPVYQPGRPIEEVARELGLPAASIIKLASNENPLGPSPAALAAMQKVLGGLNLYPDGNAFALKKKLAEKLGVTPQHLILGNGSNEIIEFVGHALMAPGAEIVVSDFCFAIYPLVAKIFGANAAKAGQIVAKEKQMILAESERESPAPKEGEIIRVLPKEPTLRDPKLIAAGLPLNSIMIVRKGSGSQGSEIYCYVNEHWVRLPSLYEFDSGFQEMERRFPSR